MNRKEQNMDNEIEQYLINEKHNTPLIAEKNAAGICKYNDIKQEFLKWLKERNYDNASLVIDGYTAKDIHQMAPFMDGAGVYNFMATLRDNPKAATEIIEEGFVVR